MATSNNSVSNQYPLNQQQVSQVLEPEVQMLATEVIRCTHDLWIAQSQLLQANSQLEQRIQQSTAELQHTNEQLQAEIRERQQIEEALRQSEIRFRLLVENAGDAFLLIDPANGRILDANRQACENLGYSYEELLTLGTPDFDVKFTADELFTFRQNLIFGTPTRLESQHRRKDGTVFPVEATVCIFESGGRSLELALVRDITERKQAEQAMARLAEIGELAAMIVHEVRNPLTTVLMGLTALQGVELPQKAQLQLGLAVEDAERLQRLLNEILLYAKQPSLNYCELELNAFLTEVLEGLRHLPTLTEHLIQFTPELTPVRIVGDRDKLKQVFINLIKNACEAVEVGATITCRLQADETQVLISVHNGGTPIPASQLAKLGTPFFTTKSSGNGLGLAVVRRIVEAHSGTLQIQSQSDLGTTVTVQLPQK